MRPSPVYLIALLATLAFAGCKSGGPEPGTLGAKLVGTWTSSPVTAKGPGGTKSAPSVTTKFNPDGTFESNGAVLTLKTVAQGTFSVDGNLLTIKVSKYEQTSSDPAYQAQLDKIKAQLNMDSMLKDP